MLTQLAVLVLSEDAHGGVGGIVVGGYGGTIVCCPTGLVALLERFVLPLSCRLRLAAVVPRYSEVPNQQATPILLDHEQR